jgi:sigma-E factor negative regulatory protein RseB
MRRAPLLLATGGALVLLSAGASGVPWQASERGGTRDEGIALLEDAARAARELSYRGTQMVSFWSDGGSSAALIDVLHVGGEGLLLRVAPTPQAPGGAVYDDEDGQVPSVVGIAKGTLALLSSHYEIGVEGDEEVAGRRAWVVVVRRPGASPAARFWVDRATHLPLRREVLDGAGRTVRESAFIQLTVGDTHVADAVRDDAHLMPVAHGEPADTALLRADGWQVPERLSSGLELVDVRLTGADDDRTLHLTFSDGLSTVSLFEQRGVLDTGSLDGWREAEVGGSAAWVQDAFPRRVVWSGGGTVFTVVADCPQGALDDLVGVLPHGTPGPAMTTRVGHGLARVGSWLNPFA